MHGTRLRFRYIFTVVTLGLLLTAAVVVAVSMTDSHPRGLPLIVGIGLACSALGGWITSRLILRIDRAMAALMLSAERIGSGRYSEPVLPSGVPEISALEDALERMRQALTGTTISRDYLDTVLNSMSDAVLVTAIKYIYLDIFSIHNFIVNAF